jgi:hypothetical protein
MSIYHQHRKEGLRGKLFLLYGFLILISSIRVDQDFFLFGNIAIIPEIGALAIFHFHVFKKRLPLFFVFILGIWNDATLNITLGVSSLCYITLILIFSFLDNMTLKKAEDKIQYIKFFYFICCYAFLKYIIFSITGNISNSYHLLSFILSSLVFYILIFCHFFEYIDRKIFNLKK